MKMVSIIRKRHRTFFFKKHDEKSISRVVRRSTYEELPTTYVALKPFVSFHTINAYEEDDHLVFDLCAGDR